MDYLLLATGAILGVGLGMVIWEICVAGPDRRRANRREHRLLDSLNTWQQLWLLEVEGDTYSRKVPDLKAVQ